MIEILTLAVQQKASDIHLAIGKPPMVRVRGAMTPLGSYPLLTPDESKRLIYSILQDTQKARFEEEMELDCSICLLYTSPSPRDS